MCTKSLRACASVSECFQSKGQTATATSPGDLSTIKEDERQTQSCATRSRLGLNPAGQICPHGGDRNRERASQGIRAAATMWGKEEEEEEQSG